MLPLSAKARIVLGPVVWKPIPASARNPPPTIAPTPMPVAPRRPRWRRDSTALVMTDRIGSAGRGQNPRGHSGGPIQGRQHQVSALGAAIEEARRSPFHRRTGTEATASLLLGHPPGHPPQEAPESPAPDAPPSFVAVFLPTLAVTYLADLAGIWAAICWGYGGGGGCIDDETINLALWVTVPVVVPALTAGGIKGRMLHGFVGSALGVAAGVVSMGILNVIGEEEGPVVWTVPAIQPAATTLLTLALH